jgi:hypothetical protein
VLRQEGRTSGHGALDGTGAADEVEPGETDVSTASEVLFVTAGVAGVEAGGAGVNVVGGASVHLVHTVTVDVTTV